MGRRGDADILFVHDRQAEEKLVAEGFGIKRTDVMYNDFVIVGPQGDPAGAKGRDVVAALAKIAEKSAAFISRGDKSGTHAAELRYWKAAGIDAPATKFAGYKECGCGMGPALNIASQSDAYVLTDRGTWLSFKNRGNLGGPRRGRPAPLQPVRRHRRQSGEASARQGAARAGVRRLGALARGAADDRLLQGRRRAAVLPERAALR